LLDKLWSGYEIYWESMNYRFWSGRLQWSSIQLSLGCLEEASIDGYLKLGL
jgi:hypothetical protein